MRILREHAAERPRPRLSVKQPKNVPRHLIETHPAGELSFRVRSEEAPRPIPAEDPHSTGTREQVYLALRLAAVDQLDQGGERLPLFLDEALVNWDPDRRDRGLALLADIARSRQVFVFTCHPEAAERLRARGARIVRVHDVAATVDALKVWEAVAAVPAPRRDAAPSIRWPDED